MSGQILEKFKIQPSPVIELPGLGKVGAIERRNYSLRQHRKRKISKFDARLREKQKFLFRDSLREEQLRCFGRKARSLTPPTGSTAYRTVATAVRAGVFRLISPTVAPVYFRKGRPRTTVQITKGVSHRHTLHLPARMNSVAHLNDK